MIYSYESIEEETYFTPEVPLSPHSDDDVTKLRRQIRAEILKTYQGNVSNDHIYPVLLKSDIISKLKRRIEERKAVSEDNELWKRLEYAVVKVSPEFSYRPDLLLGRKARNDERHIALLAKCGFTLDRDDNPARKNKKALVEPSTDTMYSDV